MIGLTRRLPGILYTYKYTLYSIIILIATFIYFLFRWNLLCTNLQAWPHVTKMCKLYENERAVGILCEPLCTTKEIHSLTCHSFRASKEAVFSAQWHSTKLVFKSVSTDVPSLHWYDNGVIKYPHENEFLSTIRNFVRNKLNITLGYEAALKLTKLKPSYVEKNTLKRQREMDNLWILIQDNEYLLSAIYTDKDVFPQLLGTCGPYYAVEYVEPITIPSSSSIEEDTKADWGRRLKYALQILDLLEDLETTFKEPFHLCDIKLEHFGHVSFGNKLKFIDLDGVYPKSIINKIITSIPSCEKDEDCDFYDCRSRCIKSTKKCGNFVGNNNLQVVCEKIFLGWKVSNTIIVPGLLMSQHTPAELASILRQCANPENDSGVPRAVPEDDIKKRLNNILSEMEQTVNNEFYL